MKAKLVKTIRYATRVFPKGEEGEVTEVEHPLTFKGQPIYDYYIKFQNHHPIGVFKKEIQIVEET